MFYIGVAVKIKKGKKINYKLNYLKVVNHFVVNLLKHYLLSYNSYSVIRLTKFIH